MSCILYYSNYCEPSKKVLQTITKTQNAKDIHFICIDKRTKDTNNKRKSAEFIESTDESSDEKKKTPKKKANKNMIPLSPLNQ